MKIIISIIFFLFTITLTAPAQAEVWYDKLPPSGEYAPLPEQASPAPKDFENINSDPASADGSGVEGDDANTEQPDAPSDANSTDPVSEPVVADSSVGNKLKPWLVVICALIASAAVTYFIWRRRPTNQS